MPDNKASGRINVAPIGLEDMLFHLLSGQPQNPEPPLPPRQGRFVSNLGPTVDELINRLPELFSNTYRRYPLALDASLPENVRAETRTGGNIRINPRILGDSVPFLYATLGHEATHKLQDHRGDLSSAPSRGVWYRMEDIPRQEDEAYQTDHVLQQQLMKLFNLDWDARTLGDRRRAR